MAQNLPPITTVLLSVDRQGSILGRHLGSPMQGTSYTSFGYTERQHAHSFRLGFNGQLHERNGLYILGNGYRAYCTKLGRFYSQDSLTSFSKAGLNYYAYCLNDPINRHDPSGHFAKSFRKIFRTDATKLRERQAAFNQIEVELRPFTEELFHRPTQATRDQKSQIAKLILHASGKLRGISKLGGTISPEVRETYEKANFIRSTWGNSDIYHMSRHPIGNLSSPISNLPPHTSPLTRDSRRNSSASVNDLPPDYESLPPPPYATAVPMNNIRTSPVTSTG